jgi:hypothetical protein
MIWKKEKKTKMKISYFLIITLPFLFLLGLLGLYFWGHLETVIFYSLLYGFIISTINIILGLIFIWLGLDKSDQVFLIVVFGGLILRFFLVLALIIITLKFLYVRLDSFIFTTFIFYFYYLIAEIYILSQKKNIKIKTGND